MSDATERPPDIATVLARRNLTQRILILVALVVVLALLIARVPGLGGLRREFEHANAGWIVAAAACELLSVIGFTLAFYGAFADRLCRRHATSISLTAQGVNVLVPAGGTGGLAVVGVVMARAGIPKGLTASRLVALFILTGVAGNILLLVVGGFGVGTGLLPGHASAAASLLPAAIAAAAVVALLLIAAKPRIEVGSEQHGARFHVRNALAHLHDGLCWSIELVTARNLPVVLGALAFVIFDLGSLAAAFHAIGSSGRPVGIMLLAYTLGQAGSVIPLPGTTEGGLLGVFLLYGAPLAPTTAAILVYRAAQLAVPLLLGLIGMVDLRHFVREGPAVVQGELGR
jgi:uncharacterized membrane protein YbhN (UPF0104 family)